MRYALLVMLVVLAGCDVKQPDRPIQTAPSPNYDLVFVSPTCRVYRVQEPRQYDIFIAESAINSSSCSVTTNSQ